MHQPAITLTLPRNPIPRIMATRRPVPAPAAATRSATQPPADKLAYWKANLPAGHTLHKISTRGPASDGLQIDPAGCVNIDAYLTYGAVLWHHGKDPARGAIPIGRCVDLWHQDGTLYAVTRWLGRASQDLKQDLKQMHDAGELSSWSIGWLPVGPLDGNRVNRWWLFEYSLEPTPADPAATTILSRTGIDV